MKQPKLFIAALAMIIISSCENEVIRGHGSVISESRTLDDFHSVRSELAANIYLSQDSEQEVRIETNENLMGAIQTYVLNGELIIRTDYNIRNITRLDVYLSAENYHKITLTGSGNIRNISCMNVENLDIRITGSGNVELCGEVDALTATVTGSGNMDFFGMMAQTADVNVTGSGDIEVLVEEALDVSISGSGKVYYKGTPVIQTQISGSGKIVNAN